MDCRGVLISGGYTEYIEELSVDEAADVLEKMDADDAVDILDNVSEEERQALISHMEKDAKEDVCLIYSYNDDEIGSKMTTNFICINNRQTIKGAMKELVSQAEENDNVNTIYVVDDNNIYYGAIDLKDLIVYASALLINIGTLTPEKVGYYKEAIKLAKEYDRRLKGLQ